MNVRAISLTALALALAACDPELAAPSSPSPAPPRTAPDVVGMLERFDFVPETRVALQIPRDKAIEWHAFSVREPLLVSSCEVTRDEWRARLAERRAEMPRVATDAFDAWRPETADWPAAFMTAPEARAYAQSRGMRLLTFEEWVACAVGPNQTRYPWGVASQRSAANTLDLNLRPPRPTAVGTFEYGRSWRGPYDLLGNVSEWVDGLAPNDAASDGRAWAMGGSYLTWSAPIYDKGEFFGVKLDPLARLPDVGLRCAAPARAWLTDHASELASAGDATRRLFAIGRRWGAAAVPLLRELASIDGLRAACTPLFDGARE
jgi:hypothetical protein